MEDLKELVENIVEYTRTWSINENEWYWNIEILRNSENGKNEHITQEEFERAIREEILYCLVYNINSIKIQMENDICCGYESELFDKASIELEEKIRKFDKAFKIERVK